jgi:hypothetical protein
MNSLLMRYAKAESVSPVLRRAAALAESSTLASQISHGVNSSLSTKRKSGLV